jgi:hypothetical protein
MTNGTTMGRVVGHWVLVIGHFRSTLVLTGHWLPILGRGRERRRGSSHKKDENEN